MAGAAGGVHRSFASLQDDSYFLSGGAAGGSQAQPAEVKGGQERPLYTAVRALHIMAGDGSRCAGLLFVLQKQNPGTFSARGVTCPATN
jgi:hypothetical protein